MIKNKLGNFVKIMTGKLDANAGSIDGEYPFFTCSKEPLKIRSFSYDCKCVLVAGNGDLNVKYYEGKFDAYQRTYIIESKDESILDTRYLYWFLFKYVEKLRELSIGGVIKYIKINNLTDPIIPMPPIEDQKRIVKILDKTDAICQKRKQAIGLLDDYLKSVFLEMFGDPVKNDKGWEIATINELVLKIFNETPKNNPNKKYSYIDISCVDNVSKKIIKINEVLGKNAPSRARQLVLINDILISTVRPNLNSIAVVKENYINSIASTGFCVLRNDILKIDYNYLFQICRSISFINALVRIARGANYPAVSDKQVKGIEIGVPPVELQNKFSKIVKKTEILKQSMLTQLTELEINFKP